jgi:hypothetical protein
MEEEKKKKKKRKKRSEKRDKAGKYDTCYIGRKARLGEYLRFGTCLRYNYIGQQDKTNSLQL